MRGNDTWLRDLQACGRIQTEAIKDLRRLLLRGLSRSVRSRGNPDEGFFEDVVQQALMHILDHLEQFQGRSQFTTWAMTIAVRLAMSAMRRKQWQEFSLESLTEDRELAPALAIDATASPSHQAEQHALFESLKRLIDDALTEKQWTALTAELSGMPLEEIARHTGSNVNAVYKLLHDARKRLKHGLEMAGYKVEDVRSIFP